MTNSHNRGGRNGSQAERYFNNHSPQQLGGGSGKRNSSTSNNGGNGGRGQKSPSSNYFKSISVSNPVPIAQSSSPVSSKSGNYHGSGSPNGRHSSFNCTNTSYQRSSPGGGSFPGAVSGSPPNFSHFAGSKCYDAPAPTALPKPPVHWTSTSSPSSSSSSITVGSALTTPKTSINNKPTSSSIAAKSVSYKPTSPAACSSWSSSLTSSRSKTKSVKPVMSCATAAARANRKDDFAHNLKMILNVQA